MNAKYELLSKTKKKDILCAKISFNPPIFDKEDEKKYTERGFSVVFKDIFLKRPHTDEELDQFIEKLDFNYDEGYGSQELEGTVWLKNGTWLTRGEYDGSEWWDLHSLPDIPEELNNKGLERELKINQLLKK